MSVSALAVRPNDASRFGQGGLSAKALQEWFDKLPNLVKEKFNEIAQTLASAEAAKYITLGDEDNALGETLFDFLALFGPRGDGITDKNISDLIETLYHTETETEDKSYTLRAIIADILARFALCEERRQGIAVKLVERAEYGAEGYTLSLIRKNGETVTVSVEALATELYEAIREAKIGLEERISDVDDKLPVIGAEDEGKYLQVVNGHIVVGQESYVRPRLYQPVITNIDSRGTSVAWEQNESNGAFETSKNRIYVDGRPVEVTDGDSFDFKEYVDGKITAMIGVSAIADGFLESRPAEGEWGLTNGSKGLTYKKADAGTCALVDAPEGANVGSITVASYFEGKEVTEISGVFTAFWQGDIVPYPYQSVYDAITFLRSVDVIEKSFRGCRVGRLYLPGVNEVFNSFVESDVLNGQRAPTEIQRLYSLENLPKIITNAVTDLSPDNGFRRINTWCTGVGDDGEFEWAYKPDNTVRVTYYMRETDVGYRDITIPDVIDGMPVNGLGKFFLYNNGYITGVTFGDNMRDINDSAMRNCSKLASIKFGKGLESIGEHAFRYAPITELDLSGCPKLTEIKGRAFSNCSKLAKVTMPRSVKTIGSTAFASCSALKDIYVPWSEGEVAGAPWGATASTVHYNSEV